MKKKTVLAIVLTLLMSMLFASFEIEETSASPNVRIYAEMPPQGYILGIPVGEMFKVNINIESPSEWRNTANGIVGWAFFVHVDPDVLEPLGVTSAGSEYFLYDFAQTHWHSTNLYFMIDKEAGIFWDVAEFIQAYGMLGVGAGGDGKLCELWFKSKSQTAYTPIDIYHWRPSGLRPPDYWTPDGLTHSFDIVEDGHYNSPDTTSPTTTLTVGDPRYIDTEGNMYVTSNTPFSLTAVDDLEGVGVASTAYKVSNATYDSDWKMYTDQFYLESLADGVYTIDYNSTDYADNVEETNTIQVTLFSWNYVFEDSCRGTTLKISTDDKYFQFTAPSKTFSVKHAPNMFATDHFIFIYFRDSEIRLFSFAITTPKWSFCFAIATDVETGTRYLLVDLAVVRPVEPPPSVPL